MTSATPQPGGPTLDTPIRLLIVDDHPVVRRGLEMLFATVAGVEVVGVATDGQQAVEIAITRAPDVVLMDIGMAGVDGIEAAERIVAGNPEIAVILMTGRADPQLVRRALLAGARQCLFKHGGHEEVIDAVLATVATPQ